VGISAILRAYTAFASGLAGREIIFTKIRGCQNEDAELSSFGHKK